MGIETFLKTSLSKVPAHSLPVSCFPSGLHTLERIRANCSSLAIGSPSQVAPRGRRLPAGPPPRISTSPNSLEHTFKKILRRRQISSMSIYMHYTFNQEFIWELSNSIPFSFFPPTPPKGHFPHFLRPSCWLSTFFFPSVVVVFVDSPPPLYPSHSPHTFASFRQVFACPTLPFPPYIP